MPSLVVAAGCIACGLSTYALVRYGPTPPWTWVFVTHVLSLWLLAFALVALGAGVLTRRLSRESTYAAYDKYPLEEEDEWGDLRSFRDAAGKS
jgi:cytochrome c-type biogenesis protein CcmH/NrfF